MKAHAQYRSKRCNNKEVNETAKKITSFDELCWNGVVIKKKYKAFEKCWAHSPLRAASRKFTRCR